MVVLYNQPNPGRASGPLRILDMHIMFTRAFTPREFFTIGGSAIPRSLPWSFAAAMFAFLISGGRDVGRDWGFETASSGCKVLYNATARASPDRPLPNAYNENGSVEVFVYDYQGISTIASTRGRPDLANGTDAESMIRLGACGTLPSAADANSASCNDREFSAFSAPRCQRAFAMDHYYLNLCVDEFVRCSFSPTETCTPVRYANYSGSFAARHTPGASGRRRWCVQVDFKTVDAITGEKVWSQIIEDPPGSGETTRKVHHLNQSQVDLLEVGQDGYKRWFPVDAAEDGRLPPGESAPWTEAWYAMDTELREILEYDAQLPRNSAQFCAIILTAHSSPRRYDDHPRLVAKRAALDREVESVFGTVDHEGRGDRQFDKVKHRADLRLRFAGITFCEWQDIMSCNLLSCYLFGRTRMQVTGRHCHRHHPSPLCHRHLTASTSTTCRGRRAPRAIC